MAAKKKQSMGPLGCIAMLAIILIAYYLIAIYAAPIVGVELPLPDSIEQEGIK